ncbi:glutathione S-transferase T2-like [Miscanthus floridulus]|uniref:glutathione S-transferase T2-like n=1 Tax=Miscanthus floridulus TaxID=154761 RepID=UPI0034576974
MLPNFPSQHGNQQGPNLWVRPPGGYLNLLQQPQYPPQPHMQGENFHLVGQAMSFNPISPPPPPPPSAYGTETSQAMKQGHSTKETVNIDIEEGDNSEANIVVKKRYWSHEEEERLASAWLNASKDPIHGNDKRGDTFWKEVTDVFNKKGNGKRRREINQLKVHWSRLKSSTSDFNDYWTKVTQIHTSGYSDDMLEKEAQKMYANRFGKPFPLVHWWKILKEEPKWCAQFQTERDKTKIVDILEEHSRPIGREAAKAEPNGKCKKENVIEGIVILGDNIEKIIKVQQDRKVEREKVMEAQIQISNANLKATKEQKEAKMFEVYNSLLNQDTSHMSEDQKASRDKALRKLEEKLFAD